MFQRKGTSEYLDIYNRINMEATDIFILYLFYIKCIDFGSHKSEPFNKRKQSI